MAHDAHDDAHDPLKHPEVRLASGPAYVAGFLIATILMMVSLYIARHPALAPHTMLVLAGVAGLVVLFQLVLLMQLNVTPTQIWTTVSFVLAFPLFVIAVGLSMWMFHSLDARTMLMGLMH
ncbi:hypothetical protein [Acidiferrobacter sp.]|uniref:hypothetical protein n=1 Tax=Acidiferrobacter sp. TaxID=1872107 RepID=UPI002607052F|nr:hypothetical protein [Acidiferrobacter sp.]